MLQGVHFYLEEAEFDFECFGNLSSFNGFISKCPSVMKV